MRENPTSPLTDFGTAGNPRRHRVPVGILALLAILMFGDVLVRPGRVLSELGTDLSSQFLPWLEFGFGQLRHGHLPLWNPYIYGGIPYVGGFQSALFYPPNWVHLLFPLTFAINLLITLHTFLAGLFMYWWACRRGLHPVAAVVSGVLLMFCGAGFLHIYAGHLPHLYAMPWVPLLFLVVDEICDRFQMRWCLVGMGALAMQILAGHPQYVFYTGVALAIYACFRIRRAPRRLWLLGGMGLVFLGGAALSAVQLLAGLAAADESLRSVGIPFKFAAMFSFPPESFLTLLAPGFFGDMADPVYWGRGYLWEMCLFVGTTGVVLAILGACRGDKTLRRHLLPMVLVLLWLALGSRTPLLHFLYNYVPGFKQFRGNSKFIWQASVFLVMLAGVGLHHLLHSEGKHSRVAAGILSGAGVAALLGLFLQFDSDLWMGFVRLVLSSQESYLPARLASDPSFMPRMAHHASWCLFIAAGTLALLGILVLNLSRSRRLVYGIACLAAVEVFVFARYFRASFDTAQLSTDQYQEFFKDHPGDYRVLNLENPNLGLSTKVPDLWGNDPGGSLRYAQFMGHTQGDSPESVSQYLTVRRISPLYPMLRLRYLFTGTSVVEVKNPMPRLSLIHRCSVISGRDRLFAAMDDPAFDPTRSVVLESSPEPSPVVAEGEVRDSVRIQDSSTDHLTLEAEVATPAILLVTDGYNKDWRASPLPGSVQTNYEVMPANYVLMAIPLTAGHHHLRLAYAPPIFRLGLWISVVSLLAYLTALMWVWKKCCMYPWRPSPALSP